MGDAARAACCGCWIPLIQRLLNLSAIKGWKRGTFRNYVLQIAVWILSRYPELDRLARPEGRDLAACTRVCSDGRDTGVGISCGRRGDVAELEQRTDSKIDPGFAP